MRVSLSEIKRALIGVRLICATENAAGFVFQGDVYEVVNVTRSAILLVWRRADGSLSSRFSIEIATGKSKKEIAPGCRYVLHPKQAELLRGLAGE